MRTLLITFWANIKTFALVTMVSALIWVWAENESLTSVVVSPRIDLAVPNGALAWQIDGAEWTGTARLTLRGSNAAVDGAQRVLAAPVMLTPGLGSIPSVAGEHVVDILVALREHPLLRRLGVTFTEAEPPTIKIKLTELEAVNLPVIAALDGAEFDGEPMVAPKTVTMKLPKGLAALLPKDGTATALIDEEALARFSGAGVSSALGGNSGLGPFTVQAKVVVPSIVGVLSVADAQRVVIVPETVAVSFKIKSRIESLLIPEVPVWIVLPSGGGERYSVAAEEASIANVKVTGPREAIRAMRAAGDPVRGYVVLSEEDLRVGITSKAVQFSLAPTLLKFEAPNPTVKLLITAR